MQKNAEESGDLTRLGMRKILCQVTGTENKVMFMKSPFLSEWDNRDCLDPDVPCKWRVAPRDPNPMAGTRLHMWESNKPPSHQQGEQVEAGRQWVVGGSRLRGKGTAQGLRGLGSQSWHFTSCPSCATLGRLLNISGWASVSYSIKGEGFIPSLPARKFCFPGFTSQMPTAMFPNPPTWGSLALQETSGHVTTGCHTVGRGYCCWH